MMTDKETLKALNNLNYLQVYEKGKADCLKEVIEILNSRFSKNKGNREVERELLYIKSDIEQALKEMEK